MHTKSITALIVDPDDKDAVFLKTAFELDSTLAYHVTTARNFTDAVKALSTGAYDVIISALTLPESRGLDTFHLFKKTAHDIPFIALVSPDEQDIAAKAIDEGAHDFIIKGTPDLPFYKRALFHVIENKKSFRDLKDLDEIKTNFTSMMTHELRTPLVSIKGFVSLLLHEVPGKINDRQKEYLNIIMSNAERQIRMINEMLDIAKIEAGAFSIEKKQTDLVKLIDKTVKEVSSLATEKKITLADAIREKEIIIEIDDYRISQVIINLLNNSLKFSPEGGTITIKALVSVLSEIHVPATVDKNALEHDTYVLVSIMDEGEGIDPADLPKVFSRFSQVSKSKEKREKGTGLGLSISKSIVETHRGVIWVESEGRGKGTTFSFILPV